MNVKTLREHEIERLISYAITEEGKEDATARRLMNSFYRLCGLAETNLYLQNNERTHNTPYAQYCEERETKWCKRLCAEFQKHYGLKLYYAGYMPSIGTVNEHGACAEKISRYFYN